MKSRRNLAPVVALVLLSVAGAAFARSSDRRQAIDIEGGSAVYSTDDSRPTVLSGGVTITQGTLRITSSTAEITMVNGEAVRAVLRGGPVKMSQQLDDGTPMSSTSAAADYDMKADVVVLSGNVTVQQTRGTLTGDRVNYNMKTGQVASGAAAGGGRVKMHILPKNNAGTP
ncbi:lipopolysaccharide transport periplasmic protein LptA [Lysobacter sp. TY2-98]|uniref:lipopolysaccharide transport periplasmic protein LptA n=1 Tax=Lysobacter sp. TY2-98 TaxID=2290922 RepID=UPI000E1FDACC|nr:lipopolysaccharide transport periplasmic protein LptA [Lysobacter sp. TY2-98]AXK71393.1 lipopolysaccharide transport periplasmic protein LptA [Lysobacter sp. TY2-98]